MSVSRFPGYRFPAVIIGEVIWLRYRFNLSLRDIPALVARSGIVVSHETVRQWCDTFGPDYAKQVRGAGRRVPVLGVRATLRALRFPCQFSPYFSSPSTTWLTRSCRSSAKR